MQQQKRHIELTVPVIGLIIFIVLSMTSCVTNGYGCRGNSKIMTRVR